MSLPFFKTADAKRIRKLREELEEARDLHRRGHFDAAIARCRQIASANPGSAEAHYLSANVLKDQGHLESAIAEYDQALELKPEHARALGNRAVVLGQMLRFSEALTSYDRAIELDPGDALIHCNRAMLLNAVGRKDAARDAFERAIAVDPGLAAAHFGQGALLQESRQWMPALKSYDRAVAIDPGDIASHFNRATVLSQLERRRDALAAYDRVLALKGDFAQAHAGRARCLQELNMLVHSLDSYDRALGLLPGDAALLTGRGVVLQGMTNYAAALASYTEAIALKPDFSQAYFNRGTLHSDLQQFEAAIADYRCAIAIEPQFAEAHLNLALTCLKAGNYREGWLHYEWRWRVKRGPIANTERTFVQPLWLGESEIAGRTILIYGEQGLGDTLQFSRFCTRVAAQGAKVILQVARPLVSVCATVEGVSQVISDDDQLPAFDVRCPLMSLPLALQVTLETVGTTTPYLRSDLQKVAAWHRRLGTRSKPLVGLTWSGSAGSRTFSPRSFPLAGLLEYLPDDCDYVSTQTEIMAADQITLTGNPTILRFDQELLDFGDTAALCQCLDLIITIDTSITHMNGAIRKPTWVLLPFDNDWRWLVARDDSPWYPTVRLFRQKSRGDWNEVFERVAAQLRLEFAADPGRPPAAD